MGSNNKFIKMKYLMPYIVCTIFIVFLNTKSLLDKKFKEKSTSNRRGVDVTVTPIEYSLPYNQNMNGGYNQNPMMNAGYNQNPMMNGQNFQNQMMPGANNNNQFMGVQAKLVTRTEPPLVENCECAKRIPSCP